MRAFLVSTVAVGFLILPWFTFAAESQSTVTIAIGSTTAPIFPPPPPPPPPSTTTPTTTPATTTPQFGNGTPVSDTTGYIPLEIRNLVVVPTLTNAAVSWQTNRPVRGRIVWGTTLDFELGTIQSADVSEAHAMTVPGLRPGQVYFLTLEVVGTDGHVAHHANIRFETLLNFEPGIVPNVDDFTLSAVSNAVVGRWNNPIVSDLDSVRVVRSERFFPRDPVDGIVVYEGRGAQFVDTSVVPGRTYFYAVFTRSVTGVFSSGAVQMITVPGVPAGAAEGTATVPQVTSPGVHVPAGVASLELDDFIFQDAATELRFVGSELFLTQGHSITVLLPFTLIPGSVKTIVVAFGTTTDATVTTGFLLRPNDAKGSLESVLPIFEIPGERSFAIDIFGFDNTRIKRLSGTLKIIPMEGEKPYQTGYDFMLFIFLLFLLLLSLFLAIFYRKLYTRLSM